MSERLVIEADDYLGIALHVIAQRWIEVDKGLPMVRGMLRDSFAVLYERAVDDHDLKRWSDAVIEP